MAGEVAPYEVFLAERGELLRHKWLMSEQTGWDVGIEAALLDWALHHRAAWRAERQGAAREARQRAGGASRKRAGGTGGA
jgi:hypothetical protein